MSAFAQVELLDVAVEHELDGIASVTGFFSTCP